MAELVNDGGALRLVFALTQRQSGALPVGEGTSGRLLAGAGLEYLDVRDGEWWPILRLPVLYVAAGGVTALADDLRALLAGGAGFAWRDEDGALALQFAPDAGGAVVEVGIDVGRFLADVAGAAPRAGSELALFRFRAAQGALVRFAGALAGELGDLA